MKSDYVAQGQWKWVWNDVGSGADRDVTVWEAVSSGAGQGVQGMSAVPCHCGMDRTAYVLNPTYIQYIISKPVQHYYLTNIVYKIDARQILSQEPQILARTTLINNGGLIQEVWRKVTYTYEETYTWSNTVGLEIGISVTVTAGVPQLASSLVNMIYGPNLTNFVITGITFNHVQVITSITAKCEYTTSYSLKSEDQRGWSSRVHFPKLI